MNYYLIRFEYDHWCQGYEKAHETVLVKEISYGNACRTISEKYRNARQFENLTL